MSRKHEPCEACQHNHGTHNEAHDRYNQLTEVLGASLELGMAIQVIDALASQSQEAFDKMLESMRDSPLAFINMLNISSKDE